MSGAEKSNKKTLLGYELSAYHDAIINYLIPSITSSVVYIFLFACDVGVVFRHYKDDNPIWASLTIFFIYFPIIGCYIVTVSSWELWPNPEGYGPENFKWFVAKTMLHLCFPVWAIWRYAERIFWSIEAVRAKNDNKSIEKYISLITAPRNVELYLFFQGYMQTLPQMLLQLHILMLKSSDLAKPTADIQIACLFFNLSKMAATTAFYQRFKSQKLTGKQYPWFKHYKNEKYAPVTLRRKSPFPSSRSIVEDRPKTSNIEDNYNVEPPTIPQRRRSSDFYLEPASSFTENNPQTDDNDVLTRETSVVDGPRRHVFRQTGTSGTSEPDFNIRRLVNIKGLPDDDFAGRLVSFCWWFGFLLARILAIATFTYFYKKQVVWLLLSHFVIIEAFLIYDAKTDEVKRAKAVFFVFLGLIYIFCIIEFKIKFKKTKFIYYGYFTLMYLENFVMCLIWWFSDIGELETDFWFRYVFYVIVMGSIFSLFSMLFYLNINKPKKVVVGQQVL